MLFWKKARNQFLAVTLICLVSTPFSAFPAIAAPPLTPRIENVYSDSSTTATVIFYGKVATVGDSPTTYTAVSTPNGKSASITSLGEGGRGVVTVKGLLASTAYTFVVTARNTDGFSESFQSGLVTTLASGLVPEFNQTISTSTGFTTSVSNFNSSFTYTVKSDKGSASIAPYDGSIVVENIGNPGELATITVTSTRVGYDSVSATLSARSKSSNEPSRLTAKSIPRIVRSGNIVECTAGEYEFLRNGKYAEFANISSATYILEVASTYQSIFSSDDFNTSPRFLFPEFSNRLIGTGSTKSVKWDVSTLEKKGPIKCLIFAFQEGASISSTTVTISDAVVPNTRPIRKVINCKKGSVIRKVSGLEPKCPRGYVLVP